MRLRRFTAAADRTLPSRFTRCVVAARTVAPAPVIPPSLSQRTAAHRAAWERRPVRGVRAKKVNRVWRRYERVATVSPLPYGPAGCRHDSSPSFEPAQATRHRQHNRRKTRFSTRANREPITGSPGEATCFQRSDAVSLCARVPTAGWFPLSTAGDLAPSPAAAADWRDRRA